MLKCVSADLVIDSTHITEQCLEAAVYNLQYFRNFIEKWHPIKMKTEKGIPLDPKFSAISFIKVFGTANATNITGQDDELLLIAFFEALLEHEASVQYQKNTDSTVAKLLNIDESQFPVSGIKLRVWGNISSNRQLTWRTNLIEPANTGTSWTSLLQTIFNLPRLDALTTLANILRMSFENLHQLSSNPHAAELHGTRMIDDGVPNLLQLRGFPNGLGCAKLIGKTHISGNANQVIGAFLRYRLDENDFCLPATVGSGELCVGKYKPTAHFFNQHLMDKHQFAPVIFFQDMRAALAIDSMLNNIVGYSPDMLIVTAHLGNDLSVLPWNYFHAHDVVLVPAPNLASMVMVKNYRDYLGTNGPHAKSFHIYPGFLLHTPLGRDLKETEENLSVTEAELRDSALILDEVDNPLGLTEQIIKNAISYEAFIEWGRDLGIFKKPQEVGTQPAVAQSDTLPPINQELTPATTFSLGDVTLYHTIRPGSIVMILGAKSAGKTQVALSACRSLIKGNVMWPLFMGRSIHAGNVAYIDAETPHDEYLANLEQHDLACEIGQHFWGISRFASDLPGFCENFSLTDKIFREGLRNYLLNRQCRYVFLDNLTALMGDGVHQGKAAQDVLAWVENLQKCGMCVIFIHHKAESAQGVAHDDKARGSQLFYIRSRTVIGLVSKNEIRDSDIGTNTVKASALQDGLTVGLRYQDCKPAPVLKDKTFWLHLPLGASEWIFLAATGADGKEIELTQTQLDRETALSGRVMPSGMVENMDSTMRNALPEQTPNIVIPMAGEAMSANPSLAAPHLSDEQKNVYELARNAGSVKTAEVAKHLGCGVRKARYLIVSLQERGILEPNGKKGPQQGYRISE